MKDKSEYKHLDGDNGFITDLVLGAKLLFPNEGIIIELIDIFDENKINVRVTSKSMFKEEVNPL